MAFAPSPDARLLAYTLGRRRRRLADRSRSRSRGAERISPDRVRWMRFSGLAWTHDSQGFFYSRFPEPPPARRSRPRSSGHALYYHRLGTPQSDDRLIFERPDLPTWFVTGTVSDDGRYLLIALFEGATNSNRLYIVDLGDPDAPDVAAPVAPVVEQDGAEYAPIGTSARRCSCARTRRRRTGCVLAFDLWIPTPPAWHGWSFRSGRKRSAPSR